MGFVDVVAGIIFNESGTEVLLALRNLTQHQGDRWEFPGGKLNRGESCHQGLLRELEEEIGIVVTRCTARSVVEHRYPDKQVRIHFWNVTAFDGIPDGREGQKVKWVPLASLRAYQFPDANQAIVEQLVSRSA